MRIYLSCFQSLIKHPIPAYQFWEIYFKKGIGESGHEWIETQGIDWAEGHCYQDPAQLAQWRDRTWSRVVEDIKKQHAKKPIDFFLGYLYPGQVDEQGIRRIQQLGIPCVNFFCDNIRDFKKVPAEYGCFDLNWVPEYEALPMYQKAGLCYLHLPMPMWVDPAYRNLPETEDNRITFIGSRDIQREILLAQVIEAGLQPEIRGAGWLPVQGTGKSHLSAVSWRGKVANQFRFVQKHGLSAYWRKLTAGLHPLPGSEIFMPYLQPSPSHDEYVELTRQSMVLLGVNRYPSFHYPLYRPHTYSRLRDIEAPMLGACYLTEWAPGLDKLYDLGKEIEVYHSATELVEKARELAASPSKRKAMRRAGQLRALATHSLPQSIGHIIKKLSL